MPNTKDIVAASPLVPLREQTALLLKAAPIRTTHGTEVENTKGAYMLPQVAAWLWLPVSWSLQ